MRKVLNQDRAGTLVLGSVYPGIRSENKISSEPMLFGVDCEFAAKHGGPLTQEVMFELVRTFDMTPDTNFPHMRIDTRVHMLMPGMCPAIPGWHCDGVPRSDYSEQPDMDKMSLEMLHASVFLSTTPRLAPTEFIGQKEVTVYYDPNRVWGSVNDHVQRSNTMIPQVPYDGQIVQFTGQTLHRATAATARGWRFFLRASWTDQEPANEIRKQVQVYTTEGGW